MVKINCNKNKISEYFNKMKNWMGTKISHFCTIWEVNLEKNRNFYDFFLL